MNTLATGILSCVLLASAGGAVYYRSQAVKYERRWGEAMEQLADTLRDSKPFRAREKPVPGIPKSATVIDTTREHQIAGLLAELEEKQRQIETLTQAAKKQANTNRFPNAGDRQRQLEELKENDPEKYEEIIARREEMRNQMQNNFAQKAISLLDRDTSTLSGKELDHYEQMLNNMDTAWTLLEKMTSPDTPPEERREIRQELAETAQELQPILKEERERRFVELGVESGYSETEAKAFAEYIGNTIQATSLQPFAGRRGPPRSGR